MAFAVAANQNKELLGKDGLLPTDLYLRQVKDYFGDRSWRAFLQVPTVLLFSDWNKVDQSLDILAYTGMALSALVILCGCANMVTMAILWILYHSIVNIGQRW